jgi:molybdopterin-biosynthesis enzyme MoeA-like protein
MIFGNNSKIMSCGIVIIGDEILSGRRQDQHFAHVVETLGQHGLQLTWACYESDNLAALERRFREIRQRGDLCFSFGGIGATPDDVTRQAVAAAWERRLTRHPEAQREIEQQFGAGAYPNRILMADLPDGATLIPNPVNRVPGFTVNHLHCLPGFPEMAWPMMKWVLDRVASGSTALPLAEHSITVHDAAESELIDIMNDTLSRFTTVKLFSLPRFLDGGGTEVELGIRAETDACQAAFDYLATRLRNGGFNVT